MDKHKHLQLLFILILLMANNECSKLYTVVKTEYNWDGAYINCRQQNKALASITSATEQQNVRQAIIDAGVGHVLSFWLAGTDRHSEGNFRWMTTGKSFRSYKNWGRGQPDNAWNNEHCVEIWSINTPYAWNDRPCDHKAYSVCEE